MIIFQKQSVNRNNSVRNANNNNNKMGLVNNVLISSTNNIVDIMQNNNNNNNNLSGSDSRTSNNVISNGPKRMSLIDRGKVWVSSVALKLTIDLNIYKFSF